MDTFVHTLYIQRNNFLFFYANCHENLLVIWPEVNVLIDGCENGGEKVGSGAINYVSAISSVPSPFSIKLATLYSSPLPSPPLPSTLPPI